ncbi:ABC transporter permease [Pararhodobacter sp.]|uniref:ABC transporter permease n=1 Tax=Pararhodobacter sp. TaxID=2127056 RepID=UPI002FDE8F4F
MSDTSDTRPRLRDSELLRAFLDSTQAMIAFVVLTLLVMAVLLAPFIALTNPYDLASLDLLNSRLPPVWIDGGDWPYLLGTDSQGGDMVSLILYGMRTSLLVGVLAVALSVTIGTILGLISGYFGGWAGTVIMRAADVQFTFPAIILALLIGGLAKGVLTPTAQAQFAIPMVVLALGISHWPHFARLVRGAVLVERNKDYVAAARLAGRGPFNIMRRQLLPNVVNPIAVLATLDIAFAVMGEATLSFLGFGLPPTEPSLGTLIRSGYNYLFSGEWWLVIFPALALMVLVVAVNLFGDWLRDALNPQLR